jgi:CubicO group peptidase (beta-lactamase class C family)
MVVMTRSGFDPDRLARIDRFFQEYVDDGRLPGWQLQVSRHGKPVHHATYGLADVEAGKPVADDTLWRIYSMTKPITSMVAMQLWEEGAFALTDEVSRWIPSFAESKVFARGSVSTPFLEPALEPVRMWHLLSHTSGLTYGFLQTHTVDGLYRQAGFDVRWPEGTDLAGACDAWAALPLKFQPGTAWGYGVSTDVLGRVIEVITGQTLEQAFAERVLEPLGMTDTRWWSQGDDRLAALYAAFQGKAIRYDVLGDLAHQPPTAFAGGQGLISTAADYERICQVLLGRGTVDGVRLLAPRTVDLMSRNQLPGGRDLAALNSGGFAETVFDGVGFGLGFATVLDPDLAKSPSSPGEYFWGGLASTAFWVDPATGVTATFFTQLLPSSTYPIRNQLRQLVYAALVD